MCEGSKQQGRGLEDPEEMGRCQWDSEDLLEERRSGDTGRWRPPQCGVSWSWGEDPRSPLQSVPPRGTRQNVGEKPRTGGTHGKPSFTEESFRDRPQNETETKKQCWAWTLRDAHSSSSHPIGISTSDTFQELFLKSHQVVGSARPHGVAREERKSFSSVSSNAVAPDPQNGRSDDSRRPSEAGGIGMLPQVDSHALPDLCAGTVALCSLYYVRLLKERQLRDSERRRRFFIFRRTRSRERLRFVVLCMSGVLRGRELSSAPAPITEWEGQERRIWSKVRSSSLWNTVTENTFSNFDWTESFRMTKSTFNYLCDQLRPVIQRMDTNMRRAIPAEVRLAMTLWRLGSSCEYRTIERIFGVSRSTICKIVRDVCEAVVSILTPKFISVPQGDILEDILQGFEQRHGLPQLAGLIGAFHVAIRAPNEYAGQYFNTKGWHSVVLQAVVDSDYCFWDLNVGCPGNLSNSQVLLASELYEWGTDGTLFPSFTRCVDGVEVPIHLLGPRSYPLLPWLMTPFGEGSYPEYTELNKHFSSALNGTQVAFGRLKSRWRCLLKRNDTDLSFLPTLVAACCTLHNICECRRDPFEEHWLQEAAEEALEQPSEFEEDDLIAEGMSEEIRSALAHTLHRRSGGKC
ncbi:uncharacterized protein LOC134935846 [Pseudophryne corroboree]|uniref:uncharacterized protein LOC134935846 n=1 Tax=Pseudophryne corroboree TaxID=495146 RepID=UPI003081ADFF